MRAAVRPTVTVFLSTLCLVALSGCLTESPSPGDSTPTATTGDASSGSTPETQPAGEPTGTAEPKANEPAAPAAQIALPIELPKPAFRGTPKHAKSENLEAPRKGPREPFLAPEGASNLAVGKTVTSSDEYPIIGELEFVTDGDKEANDGTYVELGPGSQWVQIDLGQSAAIHALVIWQFHLNARIYSDVIVRVSDDPEFEKYTVVFNNDHDNSSGLGLGEDKEYWETNEGKLIDAKGTKGRYVRVYSNGSTEDDMNHHTEVEVWGTP